MRPRLLLTVVLAVLLCGCSGLSAPRPEGPLTGEPLLEALRQGGLVLYLRHTETTEAGIDDVERPDDCPAQRALTPAGEQDARELGAALTALGVPVGRVVASPLCRTVRTAELAFGRTETDPALLMTSSDDRDEQRRAATRRLIATPPADGTNTVLVGHITNVRPATGAAPEEGGTVVFRPDGADLQLVAEIAPGGWQRLVAQQD